MESVAISMIFYGVTSQDDADSPREICRRLGLISDEKASRIDNIKAINILKEHIKPKGLTCSVHGIDKNCIVFFLPFEKESEDCDKKYYFENQTRYFLEIETIISNTPSQRIVKELNLIAEKLGFWGPNWKLVNYVSS